MANRPLFTVKELTGDVPRSLRTTAGMSLDRVINFNLASVPEQQIRSRFQRAINKASQQVAVDLKAALDDALRAGVWSVPSGKADIVDTGELMASGQVRVTNSGVSVSYDAPYAALVHFGGYISVHGNASARVYLPPRPWVDAVLRGGGPVPQFDLAGYYLQQILQEFK